jgi:hypothetical protein
MNLPLDIIRTTGRVSQPLDSEVLRPLAAPDLILLSEEKGSKTPPIKRLRDRHHSAARLLASGKTPGQVAAITGYDVSRVSILQSDPAFKELLEFYRENVNHEYLALHEQLAGVSADFVTILRERIEEDPSKFTVGQIFEGIKLGADRTGHGPSATQTVNVNVNLASRLEEARKRVKDRVIDITPNAELN